MKLIDELKQECNRYTNGKCYNATCMKRGGYDSKTAKLPVDYDIATCKYHEAIELIKDK